MSDFIISGSSTCDLKIETIKERDIKYVPFHYELDGKAYLDDLGQSVDYHKFYTAMAEGADTRTSQVNAQEYKDFFEPFLKEGKDILHVELSSGISGTMNSATIAARELSEDYPDRKINVVDSLGASGGYGLMLVTLADLRDEGKSYDELLTFIEDNKLNMHHWFFSTDLKYYVRGGRISKVSGFVGNMLSICPLLNMDNEGKLTPRYKIRTKKKVITEIANKMFEYAKDRENYAGRCFITMSDCIEDANEVAKLVTQHFPKLKGNVEINYIGPTIGAHTGPGTVALFFWGDRRTD